MKNILLTLNVLFFIGCNSNPKSTQATTQLDSEKSRRLMIESFDSIVYNLTNKFTNLAPILVSQDYTSSSGKIYYRYKFKLNSEKHDILSTKSAISPYEGYISLNLIVYSNGKSGNILNGNHNFFGFSDKDKAMLNNKFESCIAEYDNFEEWCNGDVIAIYAYQNNNWVFKGIDTEVGNARIKNGSVRYNISQGLIDSIFTL